MSHPANSGRSIVQTAWLWLTGLLAVCFLLAALLLWTSEADLPYAIAAVTGLLLAVLALLALLLTPVVRQFCRHRQALQQENHLLRALQKDAVARIDVLIGQRRRFAVMLETCGKDELQPTGQPAATAADHPAADPAIANVAPQILGIEQLVARWRTFNPTPDDSRILDQHLRIIQSVAALEFPAARELRILDFFPGFKAEGGAFLVQNGRALPIVLKLDSTTNIAREDARYRSCVKPKLNMTSGEPHIPQHLSGMIGGREWGAISYRLIGADDRESAGVISLAAGYERLGTQPGAPVMLLQRLFHALRPWWADPVWNRPCERTRRNTLYGEYDRLTRHQADMVQGLRDICDADDDMRPVTISPSEASLRLTPQADLRNPLHWVATVFATRRLPAWGTDDMLRADSIVHGDLHAGNILLTRHTDPERAKIWVIDFAHTHVGPTIQDIARLEADVKFALLDDEVLQAMTVDDLIGFEQLLLPASVVSPPPFSVLTPTVPSHRKDLAELVSIVDCLRTEARRYMRGDDARPYYLALIHATLPNLYYRNRTPRQKLYALVSAAILSERLER